MYSTVYLVLNLKLLGWSFKQAIAVAELVAALLSTAHPLKQRRYVNK